MGAGERIQILPMRIFYSFSCMFFVFGSVCANQKSEDKISLTAWLVPLVRDASTGYQATTAELNQFNREFGETLPVTVINTTIPQLRDQLFIRNPSSPEPNWSTIIAQRNLLNTLKGFALNNNIQIKVRFVKWDRMLTILTDSLSSGKMGSNSTQPPDIAQIGSTWLPHFKRYAHPDDSNNYATKYTSDIRLLYYWRRLPGERLMNKPFTINAGSWAELLQQMSTTQTINSGTKAGLVMPIGLTLNLLHDYAPLVWAGHGKFVENGPKIDLLSDEALKIPMLIANKSIKNSGGTNYRIVSFPEIGHVEAMEYFLSGHYRAIIEPVGFLKHWQKIFNLSNSGNFSDYAGVAALPMTFRGGSELMLSKMSPSPSISKQLIEHLTRDQSHLKDLAENGYLPAALPDFGADIFVHSLNLPNTISNSIKVSIHTALKNSKTYPPLENWSTNVESLEAIEAMQGLWRRISQGNSIEIKTAAKNAEDIINRKIHTLSKILYVSKQVWPLLTTASLLLSVIMIWSWRRHIKQQHGQMLALLLFRGKIHTTLSAYGAQLCDLTVLPEADLRKKLVDYGEHIAKSYNRHIAKMVKNVCANICGHNKNISLNHVISEARDGAYKEYYAATAIESNTLTLNIDLKLENWSLEKLNYVLVMVLQEWIYNSLKCITHDSSAQFWLDFSVNEKTRALLIRSNIPLPYLQTKKLLDKPSKLSAIVNWSNSDA